MLFFGYVSKGHMVSSEHSETQKVLTNSRPKLKSQRIRLLFFCLQVFFSQESFSYVIRRHLGNFANTSSNLQFAHTVYITNRELEI